MVKKEGTHLVLSGKVCGREQKRFDGVCGNFPKGMQPLDSFSGVCTGCLVQITCTYVKIFKKCYLSII